MAKFRSPLGVISGTIGGITFTNTGRARSYAIPPNSETPAQIQQRVSNTLLVQAWKSLSVDERAGWNSIVSNWTYVDSVGLVKTPSGYQVFMKLNGAIQTVNNRPGEPGPRVGEIIAPPPGKPINSTISFTNVMTESGALIDTWNFTPSVAGTASEVAMIRVTNTLSDGVTFVGKSKYRTIGYMSDLTLLTPVDIMEMYTLKFGPLSVGASIGVQVVIVDLNTGLSTITEQFLKKAEAG